MTVRDCYEAHRLRVREAMEGVGLDPDNQDHKYQTPKGFWYELQDKLRQDLTAYAGLKDEFSGRGRRGRSVVAHEKVDPDMEDIRASLAALMGH